MAVLVDMKESAGMMLANLLDDITKDSNILDMDCSNKMDLFSSFTSRAGMCFRLSEKNMERIPLDKFLRVYKMGESFRLKIEL